MRRNYLTKPRYLAAICGAAIVASIAIALSTSAPTNTDSVGSNVDILGDDKDASIPVEQVSAFEEALDQTASKTKSTKG